MERMLALLNSWPFIILQHSFGVRTRNLMDAATEPSPPSAPILGMPPELLLAIFREVLAAARRDGEYSGYYYNPSQLMHVCRRWNDLVGFTPDLLHH